jgi:Sulfotransferase domain
MPPLTLFDRTVVANQMSEPAKSAPECRPDFIAVGPPRTATTWLEGVLQGNVVLPRGIKETDFFRDNYDLGLQWYLSHFQGVADQPVVEICPTYFDCLLARERIARDLSQCGIICTLRDPVERLYSHYRLLQREGLADGSLEDVMQQHRRFSGAGNLFGANQYATHLREWQRLFGPENVLVLIHDDLETDLPGFLARVCEFLGIRRIDPAGSPAAYRRANQIELKPRSRRLALAARRIRMRLIRQRRYLILAGLQPLWDYCAGGGAPFPPIDPVIAAKLRAEFRSQIEQLEEMLGRDLSCWKDGDSFIESEADEKRSAQ